MIKMTVETENFFTQEKTTTDLYFNLTKDELRRIALTNPDLWTAITVMSTVNTENMTQDDGLKVYSIIRELVLMSFGVRDGNRFRKTKEDRDEFEVSAEFDAVMDQLTDGEGSKLVTFLMQIMPTDLRDQLQNEHPEAFKGLPK